MTTDTGLTPGATFGQSLRDYLRVQGDAGAVPRASRLAGVVIWEGGVAAESIARRSRNQINAGKSNRRFTQIYADLIGEKIYAARGSFWSLHRKEKASPLGW